jgi:hypothetical protein
MRDKFLSQGLDLGPPYQRLQELNLDAPVDEFLSSENGFTYAELYATLGNR